MSIIRNYKELATTEARKKLLAIIEEGVGRIDPKTLVRNALAYNESMNAVTVHSVDYTLLTGRIFVVGGGKAAGRMAEALEEIIGPKHIAAGIVNCTDDDYETKTIKINAASHPLPDGRGVRGVGKMLALKEKYNIGPKDLVLCLISGGGSSLLPHPARGVSLKDKQKTTQLLLECGADISEINAVRKHLSAVKGGRLGLHFAPAPVVSLIISDVIGNKPGVIASGPTVADKTTFRDAYAVLEKYDLLDRAPEAVSRRIKGGAGVRPETAPAKLKLLRADDKSADSAPDGKDGGGAPAETPKRLDNCDNYIIGDAAAAMEGMAYKAKTFGLKPIIVTAGLAGETEEAAIRTAKRIMAGKDGKHNALIFGGETTPKLPGRHGRGGRNQHFAACTMVAMRAYAGAWAMAAVATDGIDYLSETAGAMVDSRSLTGAERKGIDVIRHIDEYDSFGLFKKLGAGLIKIGPTGTNAGDIMVYLLE